MFEPDWLTDQEQARLSPPDQQNQDARQTCDNTAALITGAASIVAAWISKLW
jgi:hypothetical protein